MREPVDRPSVYPVAVLPLGADPLQRLIEVGVCSRGRPVGGWFVAGYLRTEGWVPGLSELRGLLGPDLLVDGTLVELHYPFWGPKGAHDVVHSLLSPVGAKGFPRRGVLADGVFVTLVGTEWRRLLRSTRAHPAGLGARALRYARGEYWD